MAHVTLDKYLARLGYGTRREVTQLVAKRRVTQTDGRTLSTDDRIGPALHDQLRVDDEPLDPPTGSLLILHKPVGVVCSAKDVAPLVYDLLPSRFLRRTPVIAPIGRLDRETSGLLLLTDDGALNHRIASPRTHVSKRYEVWLAEPLRGDERALFASGTLLLAQEATPLRPAELEIVGERHVRLTIHEGRYHQVRRMFAAVGNHVVALHRAAIGALTLGNLPVGAWRVLSAAEREAVA